MILISTNPRGLVLTAYHSVLFVIQALVVKGVAFLHGSMIFEKIAFCQKEYWKISTFFKRQSRLSVGENFTFANACAVRTKHGINKLFNKTSVKENGLLTKRFYMEH